MKSRSFRLRQVFILLLIYFCSSTLQSQHIDFKYHSVRNFHDGHQGYYPNVIDSSGNILFKEKWSNIKSLPDCEKFLGVRILSDAPADQLPTYRNLPAEYALLSIDGTKEILDYKEISLISGGPPFSVRTGEDWGIIDCNNNFIVEPAWEFRPIIGENYIFFVDIRYDETTGEYISGGNKQGVADLSGNLIVEYGYSYISSFNWWKKPPLMVMRGDSSALLDSHGKELIPMGDYYIYPSLVDESVWVINESEQKVYIPATNTWITENTDELMTGLYGCNCGYKPLDIMEGFHFANWECKDGSVQIAADRISIWRSFLYPFRRIEKDGKFGIISKSGDIILPCVYDNIYDELDRDLLEISIRQCVFEGKISVEMDGYWGLVDTNGRYRTHFVYEQLQGVSEGIAAARVDGKVGFIDTSGNTVIPFVFDQIGKHWENGLGGAYLYETATLFNQAGRIVALKNNEDIPATVWDLKDRETIPRSEWWLLDRTDDDGNLYTDDTFLDPVGVGLTCIPDKIGLFPDLDHLELSDNYLNAVDYDLTSFPKLQNLGLSGNLIEDFPEVILNVKKLRTLELGNNLLTEIPAEISRLKKLEHLALNDNKIKQLPEELSGLKSLFSLDLRNNQLKTVPESLLKLKKLQYLLLEGNPIPREELDRISELRPDLELQDL